MYFTILHWIAIFFYLAVLALMIFAASRGENKKIFVSLVFSSIGAVAMLLFITIMAIDKYTKKGKLEKIEYIRVLRNETLVFTGTVRNVGSFKIGECELEIKIANQVLSGNTLTGSQIYAPKSGFFDMFKNENKGVTNVSIKNYVVVKDLDPNRSKSFTVTMKYPPHFKNPLINYKLNCR